MTTTADVTKAIGGNTYSMAGGHDGILPAYRQYPKQNPDAKKWADLAKRSVEPVKTQLPAGQQPAQDNVIIPAANRFGSTVHSGSNDGPSNSLSPQPPFKHDAEPDFSDGLFSSSTPGLGSGS